jgi:hypothetical protein
MKTYADKVNAIADDLADLVESIITGVVTRINGVKIRRELVARMQETGAIR